MQLTQTPAQSSLSTLLQWLQLQNLLHQDRTTQWQRFYSLVDGPRTNIQCPPSNIDRTSREWQVQIYTRRT